MSEDAKWRLALVVGMVCLMAGVVGVIAFPARADTPGCVSQREYHRVERGMKMHRVHDIFDTHGQQMQYSASHQTRTYQGCRPKIHVYVTYKWGGWHWRVVRWSEEASNVIA